MMVRTDWHFTYCGLVYQYEKERSIPDSSCYVFSWRNAVKTYLVAYSVLKLLQNEAESVGKVFPSRGVRLSSQH